MPARAPIELKQSYVWRTFEDDKVDDGACDASLFVVAISVTTMETLVVVSSVVLFKYCGEGRGGSDGTSVGYIWARLYNTHGSNSSAAHTLPQPERPSEEF